MRTSSGKPPLLAAYGRLADSRFSKAMNWLIAALGVGYAAWVMAGAWPQPGAYEISVCLGALLGVALAAFDIQGWVRKTAGRMLLRRMVRRPIR
jgi:hypothetical protein